ncbi:MAG: NAD(P)/FAD-dependent oxidoreductase [Bacilli bacterium]
MYDVIIIGTGPAGITAGIYAKRSNLNVLIIGKNKSALEKVKQIDNYYGLPHIDGKTLYLNGTKQVKELGVELIDEEVIGITMDYQNNSSFVVKTINSIFETKTVILATGMLRTTPKIANLLNYVDKNISFCAICDGFFYRNKKVCVIGYNEYALEEAKELLKVTPNVTILTNGKASTFTNDPLIVVNTETIKAFKGEERIEQIELETSTLDVDGVFIAWGTPGGLEFAKKLGLELDNNMVITNKNMETNIPGIYACGDMTGQPYQIHKATYEGMQAALAISKYLKNK